MNEQKTKKVKELKELEEIIAKAIKKVQGKKENDLCKYIPFSKGGYIHHFTLKKMKSKSPSELHSLIQRFIINTNRPMPVPPKPRAARGARRRIDQLSFTKEQLDRLLNMARLSGDKEMINMLSPKKSLATCKRDLIQAIRSEMIDQELWNDYVESINNNKVIASSLENM